MDYGIQRMLILLFMLTLMQIGLEMLMIRKALVVVHSIWGQLVSWFSKKQSSIALSIAEAEYVATASCCTQLLWMMQTLQDIQIKCSLLISIMCDNTSSISISKNLVMHSKIKHIPIKYHFLREQVLEQKVKLEYVPSKEQVADIFTKPLPREAFEYLRQKMRVVSAMQKIRSA